MSSNNWLIYKIMTDLLREETDYNELTYKKYGTSKIKSKNESGIKRSDFVCCNAHANKAVQNSLEQNKVEGEVITEEDILRKRGRLYQDRGETLLRSRGDFLIGETISCDTGLRA